LKPRTTTAYIAAIEAKVRVRRETTSAAR